MKRTRNLLPHDDQPCQATNPKELEKQIMSECVAKSENQMIFVFGSNLAGRHGKGAALYAKNHYGAEYGVGIGRTGNAYAIPTKDERIKTLPLAWIEKYVEEFLDYARSRPDLDFEVTKIGCGLAGYCEHEIKPMFAGAPMNCHLPDWWRSNANINLSPLLRSG